MVEFKFKIKENDTVSEIHDLSKEKVQLQV